MPTTIPQVFVQMEVHAAIKLGVGVGGGGGQGCSLIMLSIFNFKLHRDRLLVYFGGALFSDVLFVYLHDGGMWAGYLVRTRYCTWGGTRWAPVMGGALRLHLFCISCKEPMELFQGTLFPANLKYPCSLEGALLVVGMIGWSAGFFLNKKRFPW